MTSGPYDLWPLTSRWTIIVVDITTTVARPAPGRKTGQLILRQVTAAPASL